MPKLGNALDFAQLEALNIRIHQAGAAPTSPTPVKGQMYFNNVANELYYYDGTIWQSAKSGAGSSGPPTGPAGGSLTGTYPNPTVAALAVTDAMIATANKDGAAGTYSLRTLGTGATQAAAGTDSRFTDARAPTAHKSTHEPGGGDALAVDAGAGVGSLRTLGYSSIKAMAGNASLNNISGNNPTTGAVNFGGFQGVNSAAPTATSDLATKGYVDSVAEGLDAKGSCKVATTTNITLSGTQTIDGVAVIAGDRVLVKDQPSPAPNGIYVVAASAWSRAADMNAWAEVPGAFTFVEQGTVNGNTGWVCTSDQGGTLDTTAVDWVQFSSTGQIEGGSGLTRSGTFLNVGAGAGITVNADTVQVANDGITNAMIADGAINLAGADVTGALPVAKGGTGATAAPAARVGLGAAAVYTAVGPSSGGTTWSIPVGTHGATSGYPTVQVIDVATGNVELPDINIGGTAAVTITWAASVSANSKRVTIVG